ncbi:MAG: hypothetical protein A2Y40_08840 [Candidatus Margulisbacteria bacterium GWF2_35_9]|nr:MAG: hypothetical protein A2Y40_08840 [Candidatus Margulisbacteria bacterium GWF2_35_9]
MHEKEQILKFFDSTISQYTSDDPFVVGWGSLDSQIVRFKVLADIGDINNCSILDLGCGVGDLYGYLEQTASGIDYYGIDFHPEMIKMAKKKYPAARFENISLEDVHEKYDYVFVSGAFNLLIEDNENYIKNWIIKTHNMAKKGVAINLLSKYAPLDKKYYNLCYYDPLYVLDFCIKKFGKVNLKHDYLPHDFTIHIYK